MPSRSFLFVIPGYIYAGFLRTGSILLELVPVLRGRYAGILHKGA